MRYITPLLLATAASADYHVDNANSSVTYAMPATVSGQGWETLSVGGKSLALSFSNSTGNYSIPLDASHCYDENYALGVCGTGDNCFIQLPFVGSGITMYVFNAGLSGMTVSCSVDGGAGVTSSIDAPPPPTYQVSNVSLCAIQGLPSSNHSIQMILLDWNRDATSMKFDYALVNETFVAAPTTTSSIFSMTSTSQTSTQTSARNLASSHNVNIGGIVGATLAGLALCAVLVIGVLYWRRRQPKPSIVLTPVSTFQVNPFTSEYGNGAPPSVVTPLHWSSSSQQQDALLSIAPLARSAILRDALAAGDYSSSGLDHCSQSDRSARAETVLQQHHSDAGSPLQESEIASRYNLTGEQVEVVERLRQDNVPVVTISHVIEGFLSSNLASGKASDSSGKLRRDGSLASVAPPPSYRL